jgi:hypothetical protein
MINLFCALVGVLTLAEKRSITVRSYGFSVVLLNAKGDMVECRQFADRSALYVYAPHNNNNLSQLAAHVCELVNQRSLALREEAQEPEIAPEPLG